MNRAELKALAKEQIRGNVFLLCLIMLIIIAVCAMAGAIPMVGGVVAALVVAPVFSIAYVTIYLDLANHMTPELGALFSHFNKFWGAFKVTVFTGLFTALWSLLLVVPGIIKGLSYSMTMYILAENPKMGALEAIDRSKAMMNGHKKDLFVLQLSFIGWHLLGLVTLGIAYAWVVPYISATTTNFYNSIKNNITAE